MKKYDIVVVGGGASGMTAAIAALETLKRAGSKGKVLLLECNDRVGKKILATGNGRCNFTHEKIEAGCYHTDDREVLKKILEEFPTEAAVDFFERLGMLSKKKNGCFYPLSDTAATVLTVLRLRLEELGCETVCGAAGIQVKRKTGGPEENQITGYAISCQKDGELRKLLAEKLILATGSKAGGFIQNKEISPYKAAQELGLTVTRQYPALTRCICKEDFYKSLAGVRAQAAVSLYEMPQGGNLVRGQSGISGSLQKFIRREEGEVQFTSEGISGIVVFQMAGDIAEKLAEGKALMAVINFLPDFQEEKLKEWAERRLSGMQERTLEDFFSGILHKKIMQVCIQRTGHRLSEKTSAEKTDVILSVMEQTMHFITEIRATADMKQAQVCRGGILLSQFDERLQCKTLPGFYACGEVLNVDGPCGGYNLHFAWASGYRAGCAAAEELLK